MILPMKKYDFLLYYGDYDNFLNKLHEIGVVQIVEKATVSTINEKLESQIDLLKRYKSAAKFIDKIVKKENIGEFKPAAAVDNNTLLLQLEDINSKEDNLNHELASVRKDIQTLTPWGDFSNKRIKQIAETGYHINFFTCSHKSFIDSWKEDFNAMVVSQTSTACFFVTVTKEAKISIDADTVKLPAISLSELNAKEADINKQLSDIEQQYIAFAKDSKLSLEKESSVAQAQFDFSKVKLDTESIADDKVKLIEGWVPEAKEDKLQEMLLQDDVLYMSRVPEKDEKVPILLKNNWFTRLFEPIGELYTLPEYGEIDLTPFFAPFFMLFFGLCLGDAGYGLLIILASLVMMKRVKPKMKGILWLAFFLGTATTVMGIISGNLFGIPLIEKPWKWVVAIKEFMLDSNQLFYASLIIGAFQIIFGMIIKVFNMFKQKQPGSAISTIGWLILILGCGSTYVLSSKNIITPELSKILYITSGTLGGICILLLNNLSRKNIVKLIFGNIGSGLWGTYNMITGLLGDLLSYIRLFALGISGSVMGFVFNDLAMNLSPDIIIVKQLVMIIILVIGHAMNIFMSGLGAFVHPMRLTFVEFYKNSGFTGGGKKYKPFADTSKN